MYKSRRRRISRRSSYDVLRLARVYLESIDSPISLSVFLRLKYGAERLESIRPIDYNSHESFHRDYLSVKFLSKFLSDGDRGRRKQAALMAFTTFELQCYQSNRRLSKVPYPSGGVGDVLSSAAGKIRGLLGDITPDVLSKIFDQCDWGPGVTSSCKGKFLSAYNKFNSDIECTPALVPYWESLIKEFPSWSTLTDSIVVVPGNTVTTVPKNSKTDRTIAVEPHLNAFLQRGVGRVIGSRLKRWGVTLSNQERNRELALIASTTGNYATVDLKGASDTICLKLVELLLPGDWFHLLSTLRSEFYCLDGKWSRYEKISSMGNGFTFELESLIFSSIVKAVYSYLGISDEFRVYGDDLIVTTGAYDLLVEVLEYAGFVINQDKSFCDSYFRESCGGDYFDGVKVSPFYLRAEGDVVQLITFSNWLRVESPLWLAIGKVWRYIFHVVPKQWQNQGPKGFSDSIFWVNYEDWDPLFVLSRRPYGPVVGYRILVPDFKPTSVGIPDGLPALCAYLFQSRRHLSFSEKLLAGQQLTPLKRCSTAREMGSWVLRSRIFSDEWPEVRRF